MSQKANRLRNRLRIEQEQTTKRERNLLARERRLTAEQAKLDGEAKNLNRSVALRIRVQRDFSHPMGDVFALNIVLSPREFLHEFRMAQYRGGGFQNASYFAEARGHEAGKAIADVIRRCLIGELEEFAKAK